MSSSIEHQNLLSSFDQSLRARLAAELADRWRQVRVQDGLPTPARDQEAGPPPGIYWSCAVTPGIPRQWNRADGVLVYHCYAHGMQLRPDLADASYVSSSWARIAVSGVDPMSARIEVTDLSPRLIGIQGVRPLTAEEREIYAKREAVERRLRNWLAPLGEPRESGDEREVSAFYRLWLRNNNVIANELRPLHSDFLAWVEKK
jgi:hypothetical protein